MQIFTGATLANSPAPELSADGITDNPFASFSTDLEEGNTTHSIHDWLSKFGEWNHTRFCMAFVVTHANFVKDGTKTLGLALSEWMMMRRLAPLMNVPCF